MSKWNCCYSPNSTEHKFTVQVRIWSEVQKNWQKNTEVVWMGYSFWFPRLVHAFSKTQLKQRNATLGVSEHFTNFACGLWQDHFLPGAHAPQLDCGFPTRSATVSHAISDRDLNLSASASSSAEWRVTVWITELLWRIKGRNECQVNVS